MSGRLFVVGTPIGNLGDITQRALDTLRHTTHVFAEDTRRTRALLTHFGIDGKKVLSLHAHSSDRVFEVALEVLEAEHDIALVSDAGMPTVSDPGTELVRRARTRGIRVEVVPGPSAVTSAVALSGLVAGPFCFLGFLARKGSARREQLLAVARSRMPTVLFESPQRVERSLRDLATVCGQDRRVAVCRELTKQFEETIVAPLSEFVATERTWRGELTLVVQESSDAEEDDAATDIDARIAELSARGLSARDVTGELMSELQRAGQRARKKDLYARVLAAQTTSHGDESTDDGDDGDDDDDLDDADDDAPESAGAR